MSSPTNAVTAAGAGNSPRDVPSATAEIAVTKSTPPTTATSILTPGGVGMGDESESQVGQVEGSQGCLTVSDDSSRQRLSSQGAGESLEPGLLTPPNRSVRDTGSTNVTTNPTPCTSDLSIWCEKPLGKWLKENEFEDDLVVSFIGNERIEIIEDLLEFRREDPESFKKACLRFGTYKTLDRKLNVWQQGGGGGGGGGEAVPPPAHAESPPPATSSVPTSTPNRARASTSQGGGVSPTPQAYSSPSPYRQVHSAHLESMTTPQHTPQNSQRRLSHSSPNFLSPDLRSPSPAPSSVANSASRRPNRLSQCREAGDHVQWKISVIGSYRAGKTTYIHRLCDGKYVPNAPSTIGIEFYVHDRGIHLQSGDREVHVKSSLWDTPGQDIENKLRTALNGAKGALLFFDITSRESLDAALRLKALADVRLSGAPIILVGAKGDEPAETHAVAPIECKKIMKEHSFANYCLTSSKTGMGVNEALQDLLQRIWKLELAAAGDNTSNQRSSTVRLQPVAKQQLAPAKKKRKCALG